MEVQTSFIFIQTSKFSKSPSIHFGRSDAKIMLNLTHGTVYKNDRISETKKAMMLKFWMDIDIFMGHNQAHTIPYHTILNAVLTHCPSRTSKIYRPGTIYPSKGKSVRARTKGNFALPPINLPQGSTLLDYLKA